MSYTVSHSIFNIYYSWPYHLKVTKITPFTTGFLHRTVSSRPKNPWESADEWKLRNRCVLFDDDKSLDVIKKFMIGVFKIFQSGVKILLSMCFRRFFPYQSRQIIQMILNVNCRHIAEYISISI